MWRHWKLERGRKGGCFLTPDTKVFPVSDGARSRQSTSAACPWKLCSSCPLSTSHSAQVPSPLEVRICDASAARRENQAVFINARSFLITWSEPPWLLLVFSRRMFPETGDVQQKWRFLPACLSWWSYKQTGSLCAWPRTSSWLPGSRSYPATRDTRSIYYPGPLEKDRKKGEKNRL